MDRLAVSVSEGKLHGVETPETFETDGPFLVELSNRGRDTHVHLRLDDDLARVATIAETNPHVPRDETVEVVADVDAVSAPVAGLLTVETGFGADGSEVALTLTPPAATETDAARASDGGEPRTGEAGVDGDGRATADPVETLSTDGGPNLATLAVTLLAVGAVGVAVAAASALADPVVVTGAAVLVLAVGVAVFLLAR
ncbi:hypothetical protein BRD13_03785 [Halobacteriales archaeon SW_5_70_135]|nr:MAG: hypothetical protein BRD13_03785 [Halobacteriales archaeon SW_5_70_135]